MADNNVDIILRARGDDQVAAAFGAAADAGEAAGQRFDAAGNQINDSGQDMAAAGAAGQRMGNDVKAGTDKAAAGTENATHKAHELIEAFEALAVAEAGKKGFEMAEGLAETSNELQDVHLQLANVLGTLSAGADLGPLRAAAEELNKLGHFGNEIQFEAFAAKARLAGLGLEDTKSGMEAAAKASRLAHVDFDTAAEALQRIYVSGQISARFGAMALGLKPEDMAAIKAAGEAVPAAQKNLAMYQKTVELLNAKMHDFADTQSAGTDAANDLKSAWEGVADSAFGQDVATIFTTVTHAIAFTIDELTDLGNHVPVLAAAGAGLFVFGAAALALGGVIIGLTKTYRVMVGLIQFGEKQTQAAAVATEEKTVADEEAAVAAGENAAAAGEAALAITGEGEAAVAAAGGVQALAAAEGEAEIAGVGLMGVLGEMALVALAAGASMYALDKAMHWREDRKLAANIAAGQGKDTQAMDIYRKEGMKGMSKDAGDPNSDDPDDADAQKKKLDDEMAELRANLHVVPSAVPTMAANTAADTDGTDDKADKAAEKAEKASEKVAKEAAREAKHDASAEAHERKKEASEAAKAAKEHAKELKEAMVAAAKAAGGGSSLGAFLRSGGHLMDLGRAGAGSSGDAVPTASYTPVVQSQTEQGDGTIKVVFAPLIITVGNGMRKQAAAL